MATVTVNETPTLTIKNVLKYENVGKTYHIEDGSIVMVVCEGEKEDKEGLGIVKLDSGEMWVKPLETNVAVEWTCAPVFDVRIVQ